MSIFDNPGAMSPFFDDTVTIEGVRKNGDNVCATCSACVLEDGFDDPLAGDTASDRRSIAVHVMRTGDNAWNEQTPPRIGDKITLQNGDVYRVTSVEATTAGDYTMKAREVK